ncbi:MAG: ISNCY family transposase [Deinococcales bacterium]
MLDELRLEKILDCIGSVFDNQYDGRCQDRCRYKLSDAGLGAYSVFYTQSASFLEYQRSLEKRKAQNNARNIFSLEKIPTDTHIRTMLDGIEAENLGVVYRHIINTALKQEELRRKYQVRHEKKYYYLLAMDGTQYFSSEKISCEQCKRTERKGKISYSHSMIPPVLVHPKQTEVLSLEPEFIRPQDGDEKQDCESKAIKRWLKEKSLNYKLDNVIVLCDDLHSHQPQCEAVLARGWDFIFVCKPDSHKTLYEYLELTNFQTLQKRHWNGKYGEIHTYRFASDLPLRDSTDALSVNWCELRITREDTQELIYLNSFVTSLTLTLDNVVDIVRWGRCRWKIENENNNTLKTKGHHLEHNYGHGSKGLSCLLVSLILLSFLTHSIFSLFDNAYQAIRADLVTRKAFFDNLRSILIFNIFLSWQHLLLFMIDALEIRLDSS